MKKIFALLIPFLLTGLSSCNNHNQTSKNNQQETGEEQSHEEEQETPKITEWKYTLDFSKCGFEDGSSFDETKLSITDTISFNFLTKGTGDRKTKYYEPSVRFYSGNQFSIISNAEKLKRIEFTFEAGEKSNEITTNVGSFSGSTWTGLSLSIEFTIGGTSGHRRISKLDVYFDKEGEQPKDEILPEPTSIDLGEKSISEVKEYIKNNPVTKNNYGNGVNTKTYVTIKGFALAKIDLIKTTKNFGLDVSYPEKVIMADETGSIGVATKITKDGTSLWGKIGDYVCKETSKYRVTGFISEYLDHPEIMVTSFSWDNNLNISWNKNIISEGEKTISEFYTEAKNTNYNCAGHGYGKVFTLKNLTCYYTESDGQGKRYYKFTDGLNSIRINAFNLSSCTEGSTYNITGIVSLKNYSPIIVAFLIEKSTEDPETIDFEQVSSNVTIQNIKSIRGSQDDTLTRYDSLIAAYGNFYKTTGYLTAVTENGKLCVGISPTYRNYAITGKDNAMANYDVLLIKNENFWNTTEDELYLFNPYYDEYLLEDKEITIYFVLEQLNYKDNKTMWEILLIPSSIEK